MNVSKRVMMDDEATTLAFTRSAKKRTYIKHVGQSMPLSRYIHTNNSQRPKCIIYSQSYIKSPIPL